MATLRKLAEQDGGLIIMDNQENHNLQCVNLNKLLARFGLEFSTRFTDTKRIVVPKEAPIIGGLAWGYYNGNQVTLTRVTPPSRVRS